MLLNILLSVGIALAGTLFALGISYLVAYRRRIFKRPWADLVARRVIVNLKNGSAIDGYLIAAPGSLLRIREAALVGGSDQPMSIDGEVVIERDQVDFLQFPTS